MRKAAALKILALKKAIAALDVKELKALLHYKKRKCDGAVPTSKKDLVGSYEAIFCRADQTLNTYLSSIGHQLKDLDVRDLDTAKIGRASCRERV